MRWRVTKPPMQPAWQAGPMHAVCASAHLMERPSPVQAQAHALARHRHVVVVGLTDSKTKLLVLETHSTRDTDAVPSRQGRKRRKGAARSAATGRATRATLLLVCRASTLSSSRREKGASLRLRLARTHESHEFFIDLCGCVEESGAVCIRSADQGAQQNGKLTHTHTHVDTHTPRGRLGPRSLEFEFLKVQS
jgi:hypothetical protein